MPPRRLAKEEPASLEAGFALTMEMLSMRLRLTRQHDAVVTIGGPVGIRQLHHEIGRASRDVRNRACHSSSSNPLSIKSRRPCT